MLLMNEFKHGDFLFQDRKIHKLNGLEYDFISSKYCNMFYSAADTPTGGDDDPG